MTVTCWEKKRQCSGRLLCQSISAAAGRAQARAFPMGCTLSRLPYISRGWVCAAVTACLSQQCRAGQLTTDLILSRGSCGPSSTSDLTGKLDSITVGLFNSGLQVLSYKFMVYLSYM